MAQFVEAAGIGLERRELHALALSPVVGGKGGASCNLARRERAPKLVLNIVAQHCP